MPTKNIKRMVDTYFHRDLFNLMIILNISSYQGQTNDHGKKNLAKASLAIINGAILLIDAVLTQRGG